MPALALALLVVWFLVGVVLRVVVQRRRTGDSGLRVGRTRVWSPEWAGELLLTVALVVLLASPLLGLAGVLAPIAVLDHAWVRGVGVVLGAAGVAGTLAVQLAMADAWRIGVDAGEVTRLVTDGPFALVRNPIFSVMACAALGGVLIDPTSLAWLGLATAVAGFNVQVRLVEEPYLRRVHGAAYTRYEHTVGRFLPRRPATTS